MSKKTMTDIAGVPDFEVYEFSEKRSDSCLLIPVLNENGRLHSELRRAARHGVDRALDIIILDGGSSDGSVGEEVLRSFGVNTLLIKVGPGRQGAQLRMGFWHALLRGYDYFVTVDGNDKDSVEDAPRFVEKLKEGYDFVQGSRYIAGGKAVNTPLSRHLAVKFIHAPVISKAAGQQFTDTTNAFRGYSRRYLTNPGLQPFRDIFSGYELLAYLSVRATQLGLKATEIPVTRSYPETGRTPTKISPVKGSANLLQVLFKAARGEFNPDHMGEDEKDI